MTFLDFKASFAGKNCTLPDLSTLSKLVTLDVRLNNLTGMQRSYCCWIR